MIIVTGANGFIGSAIVWELNQRGRRDLICVDSVGQTQRPQLLQKSYFSQFLLRDELLQFLATGKAAEHVDMIIHMGACSDTTEMDREFLRENNTEYTRKLFDWCTQHRKPLIYASSGATYGDGELGFDDATNPDLLKPLNPYGESKAAFDRWAMKQSKTPPVWFGLKFFNVYGPNEYHKGAMSSVVFKAFQQIRESGKLRLFRSFNPTFEDGKQMRDFVYVKDVTNWIWQLMHLRSGSGLYNMGFGEARTWLDLARSVFQCLRLPMEIDWIDIPAEIRDQYQYFTEAKMARLYTLGVNRPLWCLENGVSDYVLQYLTHADPYL